MKRIITGLLLGGLWLLLLFGGSFLSFGLVVCAAGCVGLYEYSRIVLNEDENRFIVWFVIIGSFPLLTALSKRLDIIVAGFFLSLLLLVLFILIIYPLLVDAFDVLVSLCFGIFYIGLGFSHLILIWTQPQGVSWLMVLIAITVGSDTGAYYIGSSLGKTKLLPAVSPGKTQAGAIGGAIAGTLTAILVGIVFFNEINFIRLGLAAFLLSIVGMIGDLAESVIKRSAGVKDSGTWLAGHGGLLDRADSLFFVAPALFYFLYFGFLTGN